MAKTTLIDHKKGFKSVFATEDENVVYHTQQNIQPTLDYVKNLSEYTPGKDLISLFTLSSSTTNIGYIKSSFLT